MVGSLGGCLHRVPAAEAVPASVPLPASACWGGDGAGGACSIRLARFYMIAGVGVGGVVTALDGKRWIGGGRAGDPQCQLETGGGVEQLRSEAGEAEAGGGVGGVHEGEPGPCRRHRWGGHAPFPPPSALPYPCKVQAWAGKPVGRDVVACVTPRARQPPPLLWGGGGRGECARLLWLPPLRGRAWTSACLQRGRKAGGGGCQTVANRLRAGSCRWGGDSGGEGIERDAGRRGGRWRRWVHTAWPVGVGRCYCGVPSVPYRLTPREAAVQGGVLCRRGYLPPSLGGS